jgi:hypothetical protein
MISLKSYWNKIRCFCGYHSWIYQVEKVNLEALYSKSQITEVDISIRFCTCCYKKQFRQRFDMNIIYKDLPIPLTKHQTRIKNLNTILNAKD